MRDLWVKRQRRGTTSKGGALAIAIAAVLGCATVLAPASYGAGAFPPPGGQAFHGVSDTGELNRLYSFQRMLHVHTPVVQNFVTWGLGKPLHEAYRHWRKVHSRGMLSISTAPGYAEPGVISPRAIARGQGDGYILQLNREFKQLGDPVYIRLMPEMNGSWNAYSAFNSDGSSRGADNAANWYRQAWRRFDVVVHGGPLHKVNRRLRRLNLPKVKARWNYSKRGLPRKLPQPKVAMIWVPQTSGSPKLRSNRPRSYWPGGRYVDWVGLDTYSKYPNFDALSKFYKRKQWDNKPFMIGEYAPWESDAAAWVRQLFRWQHAHQRAKMLVYYQGFGATGNPFLLKQYPHAKRTLRRILSAREYKPYAAGSRDKPGMIFH